MGYQPHIDGMRALAVTSVLMFHLDFEGFSGGFVGVDVFFVISGFLITRLIKIELETTEFFCFKTFYTRRIRRLLPAYLCTLLITMIFSALVFSPAHLERFGGALFAAVLSLSNFYFWLEADYFDVSAQIKPLLHTWTLAIEEQFYLVWPVTLVLVFRLGFKKLVPLILFATIVLSVWLNVIFGDGEVDWVSNYLPGDAATLISNGKSTIFFHLPFRIFEFSIGALLVWVVKKPYNNQFFIEIAFMLGMSMIVYAIVSFDDKMLFPSYYALLPCLGTALVICFGDKGYLSSILESKVVVGIGLISYSLYLVHWPIIVFWRYLKQPGTFTFVDQLALVFISVVIAIISYQLIEKPFRKKGSSIGIEKWKVAVVVSVSLLGVGLHMKYTGGWPRDIPYTVNFDNVGSASNFQRKYYGGAGYPSYGPVDTKSSPDIILVGDSHGKQYAEGVYKELVEPNGLALYIAAGRSCFHLPRFTRKTQGKNWDRLCPEAMSQVLEYVEMATSPPIVIISHSWLNQITRADMLNDEGQRQQVEIGVNELIQGLRELKLLISPSILVVIGEVPKTQGVNLYDVFTRPKFVMSSDFNLDDFMTSTIRESLREFNNELRIIEKEGGDVVFLDPVDAFCDEIACINIDQDKHLMYSDASHLSTYGSRFFIRKSLPMFLFLLEQRGVVVSP